MMCPMFMAAKLGLFSEGAKGEGSFFTRNLSAALREWAEGQAE